MRVHVCVYTDYIIYLLVFNLEERRKNKRIIGRACMKQKKKGNLRFTLCIMIFHKEKTTLSVE